MNPDEILSHLRELSAQAMPNDIQSASCDCDSVACGHRYSLEVMAACFIQLDESLSDGGIYPTDWAAPLVPAQRVER